MQRVNVSSESLVRESVEGFGFMPRPAPNAFRAGGASGTYILMAALAVWGLTLSFNA